MMGSDEGLEGAAFPWRFAISFLSDLICLELFDLIRISGGGLSGDRAFWGLIGLEWSWLC
jgi:hypothetical protein